MKKRLLLVLLSIFIYCCLVFMGFAQEYPSRDINGVVSWGAGGGTDIVSRLSIPEASNYLGKTIIMTNMPGGSASIAHQYVYDRPEDGYTILFSSEVPSIYPVLGISELTYDEFEQICLFCNVASIIIVHKDSPYNTLDDLINDAKERPGKVTFSLAGVGGLPYVANLLLNKIYNGVDFAIVNYAGGDNEIIPAVMGGQLDVGIVATGSAVQHIKGGDLKGLAIVSNRRISAMPDVPALGELEPQAQGMLEITGTFFGAHIKKGTPENIIEKLKEAFQRGYQDPKMQEFLENSGYIPLGLSGDEARDWIKKWQSQTAWLIYDAGDAKESPEKFGIKRPVN